MDDEEMQLYLTELLPECHAEVWRAVVENRKECLSQLVDAAHGLAAERAMKGMSDVRFLLELRFLAATLGKHGAVRRR